MSRRTRFRNMVGLEPKADVDAELAFHLEMRAQELIARGVPPDRARELAQRRFGDYDSSYRACVAIDERRKQRMARADYLAELRQDLGYALRLLRRAPAFTIVATVTLAFGIGATVAVFSIANAVLLKPLAIADPDRIVALHTRSGPRVELSASPAMFNHWRSLAHASAIEDLAAFNDALVNDSTGPAPEPIRAGYVSSAYFRLFGAEVARGRTFTADEDRPGGTDSGRVVVLSHAFWLRRCGGDPDVIGKTIQVKGEPHTVIGVLSASFRVDDFGPPPDVWMPLRLDPLSRTEGHFFIVAARLRPGATLDQARAEVRASTEAFRRAFPNSLSQNSVFDVLPVRDVLVGNARPLLVVLLGAVGFVLLIACSNVACLVLLKAMARGREMAIRGAIGAGRWRIARQLLTESLVLSSAGSALGLVIGFAGMRLLLATDFSGLPRVTEAAAIGLDWRVAGFTIAISIVTGVLCGLVPARQVVRTDLSAATRSTEGAFARGPGRMQSTLVVAQMSLALVLLLGAALFMRTVFELTRVDPGFDPQHVLTLRTSLSGSAFSTAPRVEAVIRRGTAALRAVPGVEVVGAACGLPLEGGYGLPFVIVGRPLAAGQVFHGGGGWLAVSPGYFETLKIPVKRGRSFTDRDVQRSPAVVIINEVMARRFWPDDDPIGQHLVLGHGIGREFQDEPERQIVGVVGSVRAGNLASAPGAELYVPQAQLPDLANAFIVGGGPSAWLVRTTVPPASLAPSLQAALQQATGLPVSNVRSMEQIVQHSIARPRFSMRLMMAFGLAALLLAATGLYGVIAYAVAQRTREIGIRVALGADSARVKAMVMWGGLRLTLMGLVVGLAAAFGVTRVMARWLFNGDAWDPMAFTAVPVLIVIVALLATWIPARRASGVDPMIALRCE